jgi:DNA-binding transcriptional MerR regulator
MVELDLSHYSTVPLFNLKAVVQGTGVSATILRAWERRYGVPQPNRTDSNHRLYSERDIVLIRWLKTRVESGLTISQAVELYHRTLTTTDGNFSSESLLPIHDAKAELFDACLHFDEQRADHLLNELFALYSIEEVLCEVMQPTLMSLGKMALRGDINKTVGYFALEYAKRKTMALMDIQPPNNDAPLVVSGCAPMEKHDMDILLFSLFLRGTGWRLLYLGQNVPLVDLRETLETLKPAMVALSATTQASALALIPVSEMVADLPAPRPLFAFSGYAFEQNPHLVEQMVNGIHLGGSNPQVAIRTAEAHLHRHH